MSQITKPDPQARLLSRRFVNRGWYNHGLRIGSLPLKHVLQFPNQKNVFWIGRGFLYRQTITSVCTTNMVVAIYKFLILRLYCLKACSQQTQTGMREFIWRAQLVKSSKIAILKFRCVVAESF